MVTGLGNAKTSQVYSKIKMRMKTKPKEKIEFIQSFTEKYISSRFFINHFLLVAGVWGEVSKQTKANQASPVQHNPLGVKLSSQRERKHTKA